MSYFKNFYDELQKNKRENPLDAFMRAVVTLDNGHVVKVKPSFIHIYLARVVKQGRIVMKIHTRNLAAEANPEMGDKGTPQEGLAKLIHDEVGTFD